MKAHTSLISSLLLLVGIVSAVPLPGDQEALIDYNSSFDQGVLVIPVSITLDQDVQDDGEDETGLEPQHLPTPWLQQPLHQRHKRQTTVSGDANVQRTPGGRRTLGNVAVDHTWNTRHTVSGNLGLDHSRMTGYPSQRNYNAGVRYNFTPNRRTTFHLGAQRNWGHGGRSHSFGGGFTHRFGR